jgi:putative salt-induced outer membrane protein YdiY
MFKKIHLVYLSLACCCSPANADPLIPDGQWRGSLSAGVSLASGNTESSNGNIGANAAKATEDDKLQFYLTALYGTQTDANDVDTETAKLARTGVKYDHDLTVKTFSFTSLDLETDKLQKLDLRSVLGVGVGYHIVKTQETTFDVFSGLTYNREQFDDVSRYSTELLLGEETSHKISEATSFKQRLALYPNLRESDEYRAQLDASLNTAITRKVGLQLTLSGRYQSNPQPGVKKSDLLFLTNVTYKFGQN